MRPIIFLLLLLLLATCKREERLDPLPPQATDSPKPRGVLDFTVEGVPKENIRFTKLGPYGSNNYVVITLPEKYPFADTIKVAIKLPDGYEIRNPWKEKQNSDGFKIMYRGGKVWFLIVDSASGNTVEQVHLIVDPLKPIVVPSVGHDYAFTLEGKDIFVFLPILNWGTEYSVVSGRLFSNIGGSVEKIDSMIENYVLFKNIKTGELITSARGVGHYIFNENDFPFLQIPADSEAGEYEMTVVRHNRRAVVPDRLKLTYGAPRSFEFNSVSVFNQEGNIVTYRGFNLLPGHSYEVELSSDYFPKQRFPLVPISHLAMIGHLPFELATGTYKAALYIDGKAEGYTNLLTRYNLVSIHKDQQQPALIVLTQPTQKANSDSGFKLYDPATSLKRSEPVMAFYQFGRLGPGGVPSLVTRLLFKNTETGVEFVLPYTGMSSGVLAYSMYKSPSELPTGKYQVRFGIRYSPEGAEYVSGLYYEEIKVE